MSIFVTTYARREESAGMINDDILVKYSLSHGFGGYGDWVSHVKSLKSQLRGIRDHDFMGIGEGDLSLISPGDVRPGMRIILHDSLDQNGGDPGNATLLGLVTRQNPEDPLIIEMEIEGIGSLPDFERDPERNLKWGTKIFPDLRRYPCLLELITKPRADGGAVYYYYNKSPRDLRVNYIPGRPQESKNAILRALENIAMEDLDGIRPRAQYMHSYRRVAKEISLLLKELPGDKKLKSLLRIIQGATGETSKNISWQIKNIKP